MDIVLRERFTGSWDRYLPSYPRAVLGLFRPVGQAVCAGGRPHHGDTEKKFVTMVGDMEESFLITPSWEKVKRKIAKSAEIHSR